MRLLLFTSGNIAGVEFYPDFLRPEKSKMKTKAV